MEQFLDQPMTPSSQGTHEQRALTLYEAFRRSNDVMFYCDKAGVIQDVNEAFCRHYGYTRQEAIGQTPRLLRSRHTTNEIYKRMWESILDPKIGYWRGQIVNRAKDGREIPLLLTISSVRDAQGTITGYISNAIDLSEQFALQARVAQSEALASIGELAAVIAHEIRNPLSSIVMAAKQLAGQQLQPEDRETVVQVLKSESQRLNEALSNLLAYSRPRELKVVRADLHALVAEVLGLVDSNKELIRDVKIEKKLDPRLPSLFIDPDQVRQVVWNIVLNAIQAMEGKGRLRVSTRSSGQQAVLEIEDDGPGIPAAIMANLFKPFQTTKKQGTGLGLAIADRIIKAHGGRIEAADRGGKGTTFSIILPTEEVR